MSEKELYKNLIDEYGSLQVIVAIEELGELQKELCKSLRGKENKEHIIEEMADVYIMLEQIKIMYDIPTPLIRQCKNKKLQRTKERLENKLL